MNQRCNHIVGFYRPGYDNRCITLSEYINMSRSEPVMMSLYFNQFKKCPECGIDIPDKIADLVYEEAQYDR